MNRNETKEYGYWDGFGCFISLTQRQAKMHAKAILEDDDKRALIKFKRVSVNDLAVLAK